MPWRRAAAAPRWASSPSRRRRKRRGTSISAARMPFPSGRIFGVPPDGGGFDFAADGPDHTGAGCRAITTTADGNAIWLTDDQELEDEEEEYSDYSVEVTGRPEITGGGRGLGGAPAGTRLRPGLCVCLVLGASANTEAYACTVNTFDCTLTLSLGLTSGVGLTSE